MALTYQLDGSERTGFDIKDHIKGGSGSLPIHMFSPGYKKRKISEKCFEKMTEQL